VLCCLLHLQERTRSPLPTKSQSTSASSCCRTPPTHCFLCLCVLCCLFQLQVPTRSPPRMTSLWTSASSCCRTRPTHYFLRLCVLCCAGTCRYLQDPHRQRHPCRLPRQAAAEHAQPTTFCVSACSTLLVLAGTYKIPNANDIPVDFRVKLLQNTPNQSSAACVSLCSAVRLPAGTYKIPTPNDIPVDSIPSNPNSALLQ
jgi:hypothetical protein